MLGVPSARSARIFCASSLLSYGEGLIGPNTTLAW